MIPTDTAGRMLELLQVLVRHPEGWANNKALSGYSLCLLSPIGPSGTSKRSTEQQPKHTQKEEKSKQATREREREGGCMGCLLSYKLL